MSRHQEQEVQPIFTLDNQFVKKGWQKVNPKNKKKQINATELQAFMKYVLKNSQQELEIQLDQDNNFMETIEGYKEETQQLDKDSYTLQEAVEVLNWSLTGQQGGQEQKQEQAEKQVPKNKNEPTKAKQQKPKNQVKKQQPAKNTIKQKQIPQPISKQKILQKKTAEQQKPAIIKNQNAKTQQQKQKSLMLQNKQLVKKQQGKIQDHEKQEANKNSGQQNSPRKAQTKQSVVIQLKSEQNKIQQHAKPNENPKENAGDRQTSLHVNKQQVKQQKNKNQRYNNRQSQHSQDSLDWGVNKKQQQQIHRQLYRQINSLSPHQPIKLRQSQRRNLAFEEQSDRIQQGSLNTIKMDQNKEQALVRCPLSIKKSLAKINAKNKFKKIQKPIIPLLHLSPDAPELNYIKRIKIVIKNKKPKPAFHPQQMGLKQLFKFYCGLHSQNYNISKHKDPAKGTFDQLEKRSTHLYMHNFMLFCKDFNLIEIKLPTNPSYVKNKGKQQNQLQQVQTQNQKVQISDRKRNSKGSAPQSMHSQANDRPQQNQKPKKQQIKKQPKKTLSVNDRDLWDRDKISNYFKKQADYTLNIKYQKFIQIAKTIMESRVQQEMKILEDQEKNCQHQTIQKVGIKQKNKVKTQPKRNNQQNQNAQEQNQNQNQEDNQNQQVQNFQNVRQQQQNKQKQFQQFSVKSQQKIDVQPLKMALCKIFEVQTQQNYSKTLKRLKIIHKIIDPPTSNAQRQKKKSKVFNGQFQQNIAQAIKIKQLQRQQHQIQIKQKYLNKYNVKQVDSYSSFKKATDHSNNNALYGSGPKLSQNKTAEHLSTSKEGNLYESLSLYGGSMRKKLSRDNPLQIGTVIKQARNQIYDSPHTLKENHNNKRKQQSKTQKLDKSRFNPLTVNTSALSPTIGYKKLHQIKTHQQQNQSLLQILMNNSIVVEKGDKTNRSKKVKSKSKDIYSPLLQRMGCHEDDDVLNKYFDQEKVMEKSQVYGVNLLR